MSLRAVVPIFLSISPPLPMRMAFWPVRSQKIAAAMRVSGSFGAGRGGAFAAVLAAFRAGFGAAVGWFFELLDDNGGGVGDLFAGEQEDFFADDLGDEEAFGLVGELVGREVALAFWENGDDLVEQEVEAFFLAGGDGDDFGEGVERAPVGDERAAGRLCGLRRSC